MSSRTLPHFANPPVVETVIGVQFAPLNVFSTAHAGWFWKSFLDPSWDGVTEVPRIQDVFERFGDERIFAQIPGFTVRPATEGERVQITSTNSGRMIQVQNTRLILNWKTNLTDLTYPSFETLKTEFFATFDTFRKFAAAAGTTELAVNQWEVVYVNHIPKGDLWNSLAEWPRVLNFFAAPNDLEGSLECDTFGGQWSLALPEGSGRLHVSVQHGRVENIQGQEIMVLQLTARGGIRSDLALTDQFEIGHAAIVNSFTAMTSDLAHKHWNRTQ